MTRGIDKKQRGALRGQNDREEIHIPKVGPMSGEGVAQQPNPVRIVPGERTQADAHAPYAPFAPPPPRRYVEPDYDDENEVVLYSGKPSRSAPHVRRSRPTPWMWDRAPELIVTFGTLLFVITVVAVFLIMTFTPWLDWLFTPDTLKRAWKWFTSREW